jgi:hypothetical protein
MVPLKTNNYKHMKFSLNPIQNKLRITFFVFMLTVFQITAADFYVSPLGSDSNAGTKEKPFATLDKAKNVIENMIQNQKESVFTIWLADGVYKIEEPIVFQSEFFNDGIEVEIKAMKNANPIISGGAILKNWVKNSDGIWETQLPDAKKEWNFRELFINEKRATRARFPNEGYLQVKKAGNDRRTNFYFNKGDFPIPEKTEGVELILLHDWSISRIAVKEIDLKKQKLTAVDSIGAKSPAFFNIDNWEPNPRYFLENDIRFLDADNEWFFDNEKQKVYLKLPDNINPNTVEIVVPVAGSLIQIMGTKEMPVTTIHFEGVEFKYCNWIVPEMGYCGVQACFHDSRPYTGGWSAVPAAVSIEWAENCTFNRCGFKNLGGSGLWFSTGTKECSVSNSVFSDISGNGMMIGEGHDRFIDGEVWWKRVPGETALGNTIENCRIENCGTQFYGAIGIWCGITAETTIRNNEVSNLPYSGISIGWEWSPAETPCRNNVIDGNHIHHIMQKLSDGGGIYMLGLQPGSKLINNQIHNVKINAGRAESNGMFLDEGTTNVVIANNLIYNIAKSPLRFHRATTNLIKDNYLFCTGDNPPIRYNRTNEDVIEKVGNRVFSEGDKNYSKELKKAVRKWGGE